MNALDAVCAWLLRASWQASVLVGVVLLVQWLFRKRLSPGWRFALWLLVLVRLVLPQSLESPVSLFNLTRLKFSTASAGQSVASAPSASGSPTDVSGTMRANAAAPAAAGNRVPEPATRIATADATGFVAPRTSIDPLTLLPLLWLAGASALLFRMIWQNLRFARRVLRQRQVTNTDALEALEDGKQSMGLRTPLTVIETPEVRSPALYGFVRPRLVLPQGTLAGFNRQELYYIFLHELAHVKRWDMALNWLISGLRTLHWFNPILWFAFRRMDADREVAADALALAHAPEGRQLYGETIIKLLERYTQPAAIAGLVGILEDRQQMTRRITMIAQFRKMLPWSAPAAGLFLVLGIITLTDAQTERSAAKSIAPIPTAVAKTLYSGSGGAAMPALLGVLSPDESTIAWTKAGRIELMDVRTRESHPITSGAPLPGEERAFFPMWSPDSKFIVYGHMATPDASMPRGSWSYTTRIVPRTGGESRVLIQTSSNVQDWSPNGKFLVGIWGPDLMTVDVASGERRAIGPTGTHPRFSPDARHVVYERTVDGNRDVYVVSLEDARMTRITDSPAEDGTPVFSADGKWILFSSNRRGTWDLWAMPFAHGGAAGSPIPLKYDFGDHGKWITASGKLAYRISSSGVDGITYHDVYKVAATRAPSAAEPKPIAQSSFGRNDMVNWSPDGKMIAYHRARGAGSDRGLICVLSVAEGIERTFDPGLLRIANISWSPDSQTIALYGCIEWRYGNRDYGIHLFSSGDLKRKAEPIQGEFTDGSAMGFSRDGKEIFFWKKEGRVAVDLTSGSTRMVATPLEVVGGQTPAFTRDETFAAVPIKADDGYQLVVVDLKNRSRTTIARSSSKIESPTWSPDHSRIAYYVARAGRDSPAQVHICAADGTWDRTVDLGDRHVNGPKGAPSWSPDGTTLALNLTDGAVSEIGVLENYLPAEKLATK